MDPDGAAVLEANSDGRAAATDNWTGCQAKSSTDAPREQEQVYSALSFSNRSSLSAVMVRFREAWPLISRCCDSSIF